MLNNIICLNQILLSKGVLFAGNRLVIPVYIVRCSSSSCCPPPCATSAPPCPEPAPPPCSCTGRRRGGRGGPTTSTHRVSYIPYVKPPYLDHDTRNMKLKRPMSPHLTIYGPTLPAMTSIGERITGVVLAFYALMVYTGSIFLDQGVNTYVNFFNNLSLNYLNAIILKTILGYPFAFHYCIGIRFVLWSTGRFIKLKQVYSTGYFALVMAIPVTILFAII